MFRLQKKLQARAEQILAEQSNPFVWFFANRGEE
jgi:hypothetical protein